MLVPDLAGRYGPLPPLLVTMTVVTGLVDAFSYLVLGHVFVANMTGNVVFLAFALAGAQGFSIAASLVALGAFILGSFAAGWLGSRLGHHRGRHLGTAAALQTFLLAVAVILAALAGGRLPPAYQYGLIAVLGIAMGMQNAVARKLAVPDLTTTVLTLTITGISADSSIVGGTGSRAGRRLIAVGAMLVGAIAGALLVLRVHFVYPLIAAAAGMAAVATTARVLGASNPSWVRPTD